MKWAIEKIVQFGKVRHQDGLAHFGLHDSFDNQYALNHNEHWIACLDSEGEIVWSAGNDPVKESQCHISCDLNNPTFVTDNSDGTLLVTSSGNKSIYRIDPRTSHIDLVINGEAFGMTDMGNCEIDGKRNLWVNEVTGCRIRHFSPDGELLHTLGDGQPGFQQGEVSYDDVSFNWIFDIRRGPDGNIFVLDSRNFALRMIDITSETVRCVAGTGKPGYSGDGDDPKLATFGSDPTTHFDGPWAISIDELGNIYIGDTQNHVVRMIDREDNAITTIAGKHHFDMNSENNLTETDPLNVNLPRICSMDYADGKLYIPDWDGKLLILKKSKFLQQWIDKLSKERNDGKTSANQMWLSM